MSESRLSRFWNMVKPPPAGPRPAASMETLAQRRRQRRLVMITLGVLAAIGAGIGVFEYIDSAPQRADKEFDQGMKLMHPGKYPDAVEHFSRVLSISGQRSDAYLERGNAHHSLGESDAALADFQAAADLNPSLAAAHNGIAAIYIERKDARHALEELGKSIAIRPTIEGYYQRGMILESPGRTSEGHRRIRSGNCPRAGCAGSVPRSRHGQGQPWR